MAWVVDTCLLIDIAEADPQFSDKTTDLLESKRPEGLRICPITFIELAAVFHGDVTAESDFLFNLEIPWPEFWELAHTLSAHRAWHGYVTRKRGGLAPKRPIADILIGAFAENFDGLLTRNSNDFKSNFPSLQIIEP